MVRDSPFDEDSKLAGNAPVVEPGHFFEPLLGLGWHASADEDRFRSFGDALLHFHAMKCSMK